MNLARGSVVLVDLNPTQGHEQAGMRPAVVVSDTSILPTLRFAMVAIVPLTTTGGLGPLYAVVASGGLRMPSSALVDQVRAVDARRITRMYGTLTEPELRAVDAGLNHYLLMLVGTDRRRVHGCLVHVDIVGTDVVIQRDGTERGMAPTLSRAGIAPERIVLAFLPDGAHRYSEVLAA